MTTFSHAPVEVPLGADRDGPTPLTAQIVAQLRAALADGQLAAGDRLPSTRGLAVSLGVSRTVITTAYAQLFAEGWLESRHGSGTYVATGATAPIPGARVGPGAPGGPNVTSGSRRGRIAGAESRSIRWRWRRSSADSCWCSSGGWRCRVRCRRYPPPRGFPCVPENG